ncbi:carboxypeptidase Q-like isoform X2 [Calliopsis andreniformis]|uniref:carboxypeptidase Q-like isoform X2 n=1 Tax=Calliopsis andreniformis TaxID=337506 RepID=UPI003FCC4D56
MLRPVKISFFTWLLLIKFVVAVNDTNNNTCVLPPNLIQEIDSYAPLVQSIINETLSGSFKSVTWNELADFVDKFGPRLTGTEVLEKSIDYVLNKSVDFGLENVHGEPVTVPHWVRGQESATLLKPRQKDIALLGLGYSVGTPPEGITAEAIVVNSFKELEERQHEVPGKIVVYNQKYVSYDKTVQYRSKGASVASKYGAVAALIRSVTPYSLYTPHTGMQSYAPNVTKIPVACITAEDASLLKRMANRGYTIQINLKMQAKNLPDKVSRNVIAEIVGSTVPNKVVVVSGHIDSWDVGQGAMDDGGGAFISWQAVRLLKQLKYRPRRTIRLLSPMGQMKLRSPNQGPDIADWVNAGVPGGSLWTRNDKYFYYHHTNADTMLVENPDALDRGTALFAAVSYVLADLSIDLPRQK